MCVCDVGDHPHTHASHLAPHSSHAHDNGGGTFSNGAIPHHHNTDAHMRTHAHTKPMKRARQLLMRRTPADIGQEDYHVALHYGGVYVNAIIACNVLLRVRSEMYSLHSFRSPAHTRSRFSVCRIVRRHRRRRDTNQSIAQLDHNRANAARRFFAATRATRKRKPHHVHRRHARDNMKIMIGRRLRVFFRLFFASCGLRALSQSASD